MSYKIKQISNDDQISFIDDDVEQYPIDSTNQNMNFQQLVLRLKNDATFSKDRNYLIQVLLPQNKYYNMSFGIRLMNTNGQAADLRANSDYQFIRFITIPKIEQSGLEPERVWLYKITESNNPRKNIVNAAIAQKILNISSFIVSPEEDNEKYRRANKFFYYYEGESSNNNLIYYYDYNGEPIKENNNVVNFSGKIQWEETLIPNTFDSIASEQNLVPINFIICPQSDGYNTIFLCLKLIEDDNNMRWVDRNTPMYGRYIDMNTNPRWGYAILDNLKDRVAGEIKTIGVWGRSEQIMSINGQEIRIGPSGYFELDVSNLSSQKGFTIESLSIANVTEDDKYTIDIQYEEEE